MQIRLSMVRFVPIQSVMLFSLLLSTGSVLFAAESAPSYDKDIRPILSQYCFKCHGPDPLHREADLRLDTREGATAEGASGVRAIVPGEAEASEVMRRVLSADSEVVMPPPTTKLTLNDKQKDLLKRWIASGADYRPHWAYVAPKRPSIPDLSSSPLGSRLRSPLDSLIAKRLLAEKLSFSPDADKYILVRRAYLDLIGLPPTIEETDSFVNDPSPDAYERLLDRLLASPHYGERWARKWLDLARYADTNGYEKDRARTVWPYRDWVINAINADLPFDQFTIEQIAGDMLPNPTLDQQIATGFHRNTMLNEEGGIDPLEFRFYAMTDRVATTGTTWLGLTLSCVQCHTHKYDPITHQDYYSFFALLNNADEPEREIVRPELARKRAELQRQIAELEADLPNRFPRPDEYEWQVVKPTSVTSSAGATLNVLDDSAVLVTGQTPDTDTYEIQLDSSLATPISVIRLEAMTDAQLPSKGPGRTPHGNFVLSEITATLSGTQPGGETRDLKFARAQADFSQKDYPVEKAIDGDKEAKSGWAIATTSGSLNVNRVASFFLTEPVTTSSGPSRLTIRLVQQFGGAHTIGKFRISLGRLRPTNGQTEAERRQAHFTEKFEHWRQQEVGRLAEWTLLKPITATGSLPLLTILEDGSIIASGDQSKRDIYDVTFANNLPDITAMRLEVLPDPSLPRNGPGRVYYEGPFGDFFLSEVSLLADQQPIKLIHASHSFASGSGASACLDGNQQTGWSIDGGQGKPHVAVFRFESPVASAKQLDLSLLFEKYYAAGLGRFRVWVTNEPRPVEASPLPTNLEGVLRQSSADRPRDPELVRFFCSISPDLASERQPIDQLKSAARAATTALIMVERPANNPRLTRRHHRGEFLQPKEVVEPASLSMLPPLAPKYPANRLGLAKWLVGDENPLSARVTANRQWSAIFGRGIVKTTEDFGSQGANPTHPDLLDWLAIEFAGLSPSADEVNLPARWSLKRLHRLMMTSTTYRQSSRVSAELLARDPSNELYARAPRTRLEAELVRDLSLQVSGVLSDKIGGPSVFPPQPASVTTEGTYGAIAWNVSTGEDRYRRSLYTFAKRTSPYAMYMTFDGPSGEACVARREVTNTPLQALTMLNDTILIEAAQTLGRDIAARTDSPTDRMQHLFRHCLTRPATVEELNLLNQFLQDQLGRLERKELNAESVAGPGDNAVARAAWTLVARALLNLDETIMKN